MHNFPVSSGISKAEPQISWGCAVLCTCAGETPALNTRRTYPVRFTCLMYRLIPSISKQLTRVVNPNNKWRHPLKSGHPEQKDVDFLGICNCSSDLDIALKQNLKEMRKGNRARQQQGVMRASQPCQPHSLD